MSRWTDHSVFDTVGSSSVALARVVAVVDEHRVEIELGDDSMPHLICEILQTQDEQPLSLKPQDRVLVWRSPTASKDAVVLGRVGGNRRRKPRVSHSPVVAPRPAESAPQENGTPDLLVIEAKHSLTLRVGEGSITIREDGKILIKGKDLVSHAQRMNRIKGGAVSIN